MKKQFLILATLGFSLFCGQSFAYEDAPQYEGWIHLSSSKDSHFYAKSGSFKTDKTKSYVTLKSVVGEKIYLSKDWVFKSECIAGEGNYWSKMIDESEPRKYEFLINGGRVIDGLAETLCYMGFKIDETI